MVKLSVYKLVAFSFFFFLSSALFAQSKEIRNVIVMIPDGTSSGLVSLARWYQFYHHPDRTELAIDPYLCGMVRTHSSDAPIGDSAPTTSCYMTGQLTQTGFISMYPVKTAQDLMPIDSTRTYQPMVTVLEAAKHIHSKSTGLVFTCEFPHATPADCAAHWYKRSHYPVIAKQMVYNNIDVVMGGGRSFLSDEWRDYLVRQGYEVIEDDIDRFRKNEVAKTWTLFEPEALPYEIDRDTSRIPSLAEMTRKAISLLRNNDNGFFLMVEGSKVDWAAHDNDAKTMITEFLAFDEAVAEALRFAESDGHTVVIVVPDHGNSGISIGNRNSNSGYDRLSLDTIIGPLTRYSISTYKMAEILNQHPYTELEHLFRRYYQIELSEAEKMLIYRAANYKNSPLAPDEQDQSNSIFYTIPKILYDRTYIGFTTHGHTGEDVFLSVYHPGGDRPAGWNTNVDLHRYICRQLGIEDRLPELTSQWFTPHQAVFKNVDLLETEEREDGRVVLIIEKDNNRMEIENNTNYILFNGVKITQSSVMVYVDRNHTFYIPGSLSSFFPDKY